VYFGCRYSCLFEVIEFGWNTGENEEFSAGWLLLRKSGRERKADADLRGLGLKIEGCFNKCEWLQKKEEGL
jgi:hypothetical protein